MSPGSFLGLGDATCPQTRAGGGPIRKEEGEIGLCKKAWVLLLYTVLI